jgi:hypothetical protein
MLKVYYESTGSDNTIEHILKIPKGER